MKRLEISSELSYDQLGEVFADISQECKQLEVLHIGSRQLVGLLFFVFCFLFFFVFFVFFVFFCFFVFLFFVFCFLSYLVYELFCRFFILFSLFAQRMFVILQNNTWLTFCPIAKISKNFQFRKKLILVYFYFYFYWFFYSLLSFYLFSLFSFPFKTFETKN